jgi:hypothetical protein
MMSAAATATMLAPTTFGLSGCRGCALFKECGGHPLPLIFQLGCANFDRPVDTDDMNPHFEQKFWEFWDDVGGLVDFTVGPLRPMKTQHLPRYVAKFQNKYLKRSRLLDAPIVALRLFDIVKRHKDGSYGPKFGTASALRRAYKLRQDTHIILVGVDFDAPIELFWSEHLVSGVLEGLSHLGVIGVTIPNYSFFTDSPRPQILRNWKRMLLTAERLSAAGLPVAPHINAITPHDWERALDFLRTHPEITVVTMEFQTGTLARKEVGREAFDSLVDLKRKLGRDLHPLVIGGARYFHELADQFRSFTVIDSQPFMQAKARQMLVCNPEGSWSWQHTPTSDKAPLDEIVETNVLYYEDKLAKEDPAEPPVRLEAVDPRQVMLDFPTSIPYLVAQP